MSKSKKQGSSSLKADLQKAILAGIASNVAAFATHPIDTMKIKMQLQPILPDGKLKYPNMVKGIYVLGKEEGLRKGIFKGLGASLMRETTSATVRLGMYDPVKRALGVDKESSPILKCVAGGIVGAMGAATSNPADMLKVRMQAHDGPPQSLSWHISKVYQNYGVMGFWRGLNAGL